MKATIEFVLPDEGWEHRLAVTSKDWFFALKSIRERILDEGKSTEPLTTLETIQIIDDEMLRRAISFDAE